jgi:organic hydroperoxide reductase OsmC/OhrA
MAGPKQHAYTVDLTWEGNRGTGTAEYTGYGREHRIAIEGKSDLALSADSAFRGDAGRHNPEDLLLAAVASCHMLSYLALCSRQRIAVTRYEDRASGTLELRPDGGGGFTEITLRPRVTLTAGGDTALALALHDRAHALCFIANSCSFPIRHQAEVDVE